MPADLKITELPLAPILTGDDVSLVVSNNTDYQFTLSKLLQFVAGNLPVNSLGTAITFSTDPPQNNFGKNGDIVINPNSQTFYQKSNDVWIQRYQVAATANTTPANNTIQYGFNIPTSAIGSVNDTYINTSTGIFYKKSEAGWSQVFSMLSGPAGGPGPKGDTGEAGANGKTILHGTTNPSNEIVGTEGDFYINTTLYTLFGPKVNGDWGAGIPLADNIEIINQLISLIGDVNSLQTVSKSSIIAAINEVNEKAQAPALTDAITADITSGGINAGQVLQKGTTFTEFARAFLEKTFYPTVILPNSSISQNGGNYQEVYSKLTNLGLSITFNPGKYDAAWSGGVDIDYLGTPTKYRFYIGNSATLIDNGTGISNSYAIPNYTVLAGQNIFKGEVDYAQGPQAKDSKGNPFQTPQPAGTTSRFQVANLNGIYPWFYGTSDNSSGWIVYTDGSKNITPANTALSFNFGASTSKWLWFAHDDSLPAKTDWQVTELNKGKIGGSDNLFATPIAITVACLASSVNAGWSKTYKLYISNYKTTMSNITIS